MVPKDLGHHSIENPVFNLGQELEEFKGKDRITYKSKSSQLTHPKFIAFFLLTFGSLLNASVLGANTVKGPEPAISLRARAWKV